MSISPDLVDLSFTVLDSERDEFAEDYYGATYYNWCPPIPGIGDRVELPHHSVDGAGNPTTEWQEYEVRDVLTSFSTSYNVDNVPSSGLRRHEVCIRIEVKAPDA